MYVGPTLLDPKTTFRNVGLLVKITQSNVSILMPKVEYTIVIIPICLPE